MQLIHPVVRCLQLLRVLYVTGLKDMQALPEKVASIVGHLSKGGLQVGITLCVWSLGNPVADVFA
jgi:hypothetical protein